jgi:hypothetical protein
VLGTWIVMFHRSHHHAIATDKKIRRCSIQNLYKNSSQRRGSGRIKMAPVSARNCTQVTPNSDCRSSPDVFCFSHHSFIEGHVCNVNSRSEHLLETVQESRGGWKSTNKVVECKCRRQVNTQRAGALIVANQHSI